MRSARLLVVVLVALVLAGSASVELAARQVALVVGNSSYAHIGRLPSPENDAVDLSAALRRLGFEVTTELDADPVELIEALRAFTRRSAGADVSLVFYAGHGLEMDGINYLVPVDARLERDVDVRYETVTLDDLLVSTGRGSAAAGDPGRLPEQPAGAVDAADSREPERERGSFGQLNEDLLGDETLVAYAAAAGTTAADGSGRNSPYTSALLAHLDEPLEILTLFRRVRARVLEATNGEQRPHEYQSLLREHYLSGAPAVEAVTVEVAAPDVADVDVAELDVTDLQVLAERGVAGAQAELGERFEAGRGVERDYGEAVTWYRRAAEQGHAQGQSGLGAMYGTGRGVSEDDAEAVRWFRRAAEQGLAVAQFHLAAHYAAGIGVPRSDVEAVRWYRLAADQGHAGAQHNLGRMYRDGLGVSRNYDTALRWIRQAAEQGEMYAQATLGGMFRDGLGVSEDDTEAVRWFRRAAEQGLAAGQVNLGWMYEQGRGVSRDRLEAARWYRMAADQGHSDAQRRLDGLR